MVDLNNLEEIRKFDKSNMLESIELFPKQCQQAWEETQKLTIPQDYTNVRQIVVSGMGGSGLGGHIIKSLYQKELPIPLEIVNDYHLPGYVNEDSLVILSSYSGSTEETLATADEAKKKGAKILGITTGGKLGKFLKENNFPGYIFEPKFNPCGQPRMGLGYSLVGQIVLLRITGILQFNENEFFQCFKSLKVIQGRLVDRAKELVKRCRRKIIVVVAAEHLSGNAHVLANQINENAKALSCYFLLPELDHHLLEGLGRPNEKNLIFAFLASNFYSEKIQKRLKLTKEVVEKNNIEVCEFKPSGENKLRQVLETLWFGSFLSFYLAIGSGIDPTPIPWVDYFKEKLSSS